jgi:hypothetical protein
MRVIGADIVLQQYSITVARHGCFGSRVIKLQLRSAVQAAHEGDNQRTVVGLQLPDMCGRFPRSTNWPAVFDAWDEPALFQTWWFRRVAADADADHSHHSHSKDAISREPGESGAYGDKPDHYRCWRHAAFYIAWRRSRIYAIAVDVLACARADPAQLRSVDPFDKTMVRPTFWIKLTS